MVYEKVTLTTPAPSPTTDNMTTAAINMTANMTTEAMTTVAPKVIGEQGFIQSNRIVKLNPDWTFVNTNLIG